VDERHAVRSLSGKESRSISALYSRVLNLKTQDHIALPGSIDISPSNMDRSCLGARRTKTDRIWINSCCIKTVGAENRDVYVFGAVGVYFVSITLWSDIEGNHHSSALELNRP